MASALDLSWLTKFEFSGPHTQQVAPVIRSFLPASPRQSQCPRACTRICMRWCQQRCCVPPAQRWSIQSLSTSWSAKDRSDDWRRHSLTTIEWIGNIFILYTLRNEDKPLAAVSLYAWRQPVTRWRPSQKLKLAAFPSFWVSCTFSFRVLIG